MSKKHVILSEDQVAAMAKRKALDGTSYQTFALETGASRNTVYNRIKEYNERREQYGSSL
jgi:transposase